jgi:hypothetical protein
VTNNKPSHIPSHYLCLSQKNTTNNEKRIVEDNVDLEKENMDLEENEDAHDGRKADECLKNTVLPEPTIRKAKRSYAEIVKKRVTFRPRVSRTRFGSERREISTPLTLRQ